MYHDSRDNRSQGHTSPRRARIGSRSALLALAVVLIASVSPSAFASRHIVEIHEVMTGLGGDTSYQYIELRLLAFGQTLTNGGIIQARNADGSVENTIFTFPSNVASGGVDVRIVIATANAAALMGITPDFTFAGGIFPDSGEIILFPGEDADALQYGNYTGGDSPAGANGIAPGIPASGTAALQWSGVSGDGRSGTDTVYALVENNPENNSGAIGNVIAVAGAQTDIADPIPDVPNGSITIELEVFSDSRSFPLGVVFPDDGTGRAFIYEQFSSIFVVDGGGVTDTVTPFLNLGSSGENLLEVGGEKGLLGFALHPGFGDVGGANDRIYTYTSQATSGVPDFATPAGGSTNHHGVIAEWAVDSGDPDVIDTSTRRELLRIGQPSGNHNGGAIRFGPDGLLYIALGDGGAADDEGNGHEPEGNGQRTDNLLGSIIRIDVEGSNSANGQYGIPASNPFVGDGGGVVEEIFAFGLRNPFATSFDSLTGDLLIGDVGQNDIEEVNRLAPGGGGANFGWRAMEGSFFFDPNGSGSVVALPVAPIPPDVVLPIAEYDHDDGSAILGGFVYRGSEVTDLAGRYLFGELDGPGVVQGRLFYLDAGDTVLEVQIGLDDRNLVGRLLGFGEDATGELYVCTETQVLRVVAIPPLASAARWGRYD